MKKILKLKTIPKMKLIPTKKLKKKMIFKLIIKILLLKLIRFYQIKIMFQQMIWLLLHLMLKAASMKILVLKDLLEFVKFFFILKFFNLNKLVDTTPIANPAKEYEFKLDKFQERAILCLENNQSVLVV